MTRKILPSITLPSVLASLSELSDEAFAVFRDEICGPLAFDLDAERIDPLTEKIGLDSESLRYLISALAFLYDQIHSEDVSDGAISSVVSDLLNQVSNEDNLSPLSNAEVKSVVSNRLSELMKKSAILDNYRKIQRLRSGFLPNGVVFSSFVDLRPNMSEDGDALIGILPIVQFKISTDSSDPHSKNLLFQLDSRGLRRLKEAVDRAEKKLKALSEHASLSSIIVNH